MKSKIRLYVESLFDGAEKTEAVVELREEILQNVIDKYDDLIAAGRSEDEAYRIAVSGIGDINDLVHSMGYKSQEAEFNPYDAGENKMAVSNTETTGKGKTAFLCIAVVLYILSIVPVIFADEVIGTDEAEGISICIMFIICAIATVFIIAYWASRPRNVSEEKVEKLENKEQASRNPVVKSINSVVWSVAIVIYFVVSFMTGAWYITWLIFLIADAVTEIVKAYFDMKKE